LLNPLKDLPVKTWLVLLVIGLFLLFSSSTAFANKWHRTNTKHTKDLHPSGWYLERVEGKQAYLTRNIAPKPNSIWLVGTKMTSDVIALSKVISGYGIRVTGDNQTAPSPTPTPQA